MKKENEEDFEKSLDKPKKQKKQKWRDKDFEEALEEDNDLHDVEQNFLRDV